LSAYASGSQHLVVGNPQNRKTQFGDPLNHKLLQYETGYGVATHLLTQK